jgi:hypothetical protein
MRGKRFSEFPYSNQVGIVVLATVLVFFVIAFAGRALEEYRAERELEEVGADVERLREERAALQLTATHVTTTSYKEEELRKARHLPPYETRVAARAIPVTPEPTLQPTVQVQLPDPVRPVRIQRPPYWELWRRAFVGKE